MLDRIRDWSWEVWLGILAVAGILLAIPLARTDLAKLIQLPESAYLGLAVSGVILAMAGLVAILVLVVTRAMARDAIWCEFRPVCRADAKEVHDLMARAFGEESPSTTRILEWQRRNKTVMTAVYIKKLVRGRVSRQLVGVFKIVPLKAEAVALLEREQITGANIPADLIAGRSEEPAGLYIGDVLAVTARTKGDLLKQLLMVLQTHAQTGTPLYTRPLTDHGPGSCGSTILFPSHLS